MFAVNWNDPAIVWVALSRLLLALALGAAIGVEREVRNRPAGMRTSAFLCFGCALFTLISTVLAHRFGGDPQRITAQIIPGIGFLGAGAILRGRGAVTGLTSAATVFVVASIGMAAGSGLNRLAVAATALLLLMLSVMRWVEFRFHLKTTTLTCIALGKVYDEMVGEIQSITETARASLTYLRGQGIGDDCSVEFGVRLHSSDVSEYLRRLRLSASLRQVVPTAGPENERD